MSTRLVKVITPVMVTAVMAGGLFLTNSSAATVRAARAMTTTSVACPGTTTVGSFVIGCSGPGAQSAFGIVHRDLALRDLLLSITGTRPGGGTGTGKGGTISGVDVSESYGTTANAVVTLNVPGSTGTPSSLPVNISISSTDGELLNHVSASQRSSTEGFIKVAQIGAGRSLG